MRSRCNNPRHPRFADWGGRGITVCDRWATYENFLLDMGVRPAGTTLERIDNDGPYEPGNCTWARPDAQNRNKRSTKLTTDKVLEIRDLYHQGKTIAAISKATGLDRHAVGHVVTTLVALYVAHLTEPSAEWPGRCAACT